MRRVAFESVEGCLFSFVQHVFPVTLPAMCTHNGFAIFVKTPEDGVEVAVRYAPKNVVRCRHPINCRHRLSARRAECRRYFVTYLGEYTPVCICRVCMNNECGSSVLKVPNCPLLMGVVEVGDFVDVADGDLKECGLKPIKIKRLRRHLGSQPSTS